MDQVCNNCGGKFAATANFIALSNGLCRACAANAESVERICIDCSQKFREYPKFLAKIGAFAGRRVRCQRCYDLHHGLAPEHILVERECLALYPLAVVNGWDLSTAKEVHPELGSGSVPARKALLMDFAFPGPLPDAHLLVYDYRQDRRDGALALVRLMRMRHEAGGRKALPSGEEVTFDPETVYLVLEEPDPELVILDPEVRFVRVEFWSDEGEVREDRSHFSRVMTSTDPESGRVHVTVAAIVDDEHPLVVRSGTEVRTVGLGIPVVPS